jgi:hypothetical protein
VPQPVVRRKSSEAMRWIMSVRLEHMINLLVTPEISHADSADVNSQGKRRRQKRRSAKTTADDFLYSLSVKVVLRSHLLLPFTFLYATVLAFV